MAFATIGLIAQLIDRDAVGSVAMGADVVQ